MVLDECEVTRAARPMPVFSKHAAVERSSLAYDLLGQRSAAAPPQEQNRCEHCQRGAGDNDS
jgi:hypothetical protein